MKNRLQKTLLVSFLLFSVGFSLLAVSSTIFAQEDTATPTLTPTPPAATDDSTVPVDTIFIKPQQPQRIVQLLKLYQDQVEQYRNYEREYQISKAQFFKLNTLQSLEEAVVNTKKTMISRNEVLITYCELLHTALEETEGVEVAQKSSALKGLEDQINALKEHNKKLADTNDREGIALRVSEFAVINAPLEVRAYTTRALISMGELQTVYDKGVILFNEIKVYHTEKTVSGVKQEERVRAYKEVDRLIGTGGTTLSNLRINIGSKETIDANRFNTIVGKEMNTVYAQNSQLIDFLNELVLELT